MPYDSIHHHVENGGGERVSLCDPIRPSEGGAVVLPHLGHHQEVLPVEAEESLRPWSDAISYQDLHESLLDQGAVGFYEVKEDLIEDILPHLCKIMYRIGFEGGGPHASACTETVELAMEVHPCPYTRIQHSQYCLKNDLHDPNTTEYPVLLGDENYCLPIIFHRNLPLSKQGLNDIHHLIPFHHVRDLLHGRIRQPRLEIFCLHPPPPGLWHRSSHTSHQILSTVDMDSSTGKGATYTGILSLGGGHVCRDPPYPMSPVIV